MIQKKQPPYLNFVIGLFILVTAIAIISDPQKNEIQDPHTPMFQTTDASRIFFKNMRRYYYELEINEADQKELYRIEKRQKNIENRPILNVCIIQDPQSLKAYPFLETNAFVENNQVLTFKMQRQESMNTDSVSIVLANVMDHYQACTELYNSILMEDEISLIIKNKEFPLFTHSIEKESFRKSMRDFYRLVEVQ